MDIGKINGNISRIKNSNQNFDISAPLMKKSEVRRATLPPQPHQEYLEPVWRDVSEK